MTWGVRSARGAERLEGTAGWAADVQGSYKSLFSVERLRQENLYPGGGTVPFTEQRLRLQGTLSPTEWLTFEIANETSLFYQRYDGAKLPVPRMSTDSAWAADWSLTSGERHDVYDRIDRLFAQLNFRTVEILVGKQIIPMGVGHLFSAVSQVPHHSFVVVDAEYEKTEDAVTVKWHGPVELEARFLPKVAGQEEHNWHLRGKSTLAGYDVAATAGRSDDKWFAGIEAAGNLGASVLRGELVGFRAGGRGFLQALVGFDRAFSAKWTFQSEIFYNGFGQRGGYSLAPLPHRSSPYRGVWYAGTAITWEVEPRLKTSFAAVVNFLDPSTLFNLYVAYSITTNLDLLIGEYLNVGAGRDAEFGGTLPDPRVATLRLGVPDMTYAVMKLAF